jgi:hypothetical protein
VSDISASVEKSAITQRLRYRDPFQRT